MSAIHMTRQKIKLALGRMQQVRILVMGDLMLDEFIWGKVHRISPEAPVPVVRITKESAYPGGAANVARNLADFGIGSTMCGLIGRDHQAKKLSRLLHEAHISTRGIIASSQMPTIVKTRIIAMHQQVVRVDREVHHNLDKKDLQRLLPFLRKTVPQIDAVIIEDYGKGFITQALVDQVVALALKHKKIVAVDPNPENPLDWSGVTLVKPNRQEAFAVTGMPFSEEPEQLCKAGELLLKKWRIPNLLITLGEDGMILFHPPAKPYHTPTRAREVFDVSGAGDTAIAFFTAALAAGFSASESAFIANHAAGVVVGKLGTATVSPAELQRSLLEDE
jgi:D-glycero-beta-D-manno-heptose-7-phosphate kinase